MFDSVFLSGTIAPALSGSVAEWLKAAVLKTAEGETLPRVRISALPPSAILKAPYSGAFSVSGMRIPAVGVPMLFPSSSLSAPDFCWPPGSGLAFRLVPVPPRTRDISIRLVALLAIAPPARRPLLLESAPRQKELSP